MLYSDLLQALKGEHLSSQDSIFFNRSENKRKIIVSVDIFALSEFHRDRVLADDMDAKRA